MLVFSHATVPIVFLILPLTRAAFLQPRQQLDWINECAWFTVPLDYADSAPGNTRLGLARVQARNETSRKGSLLINPGGPSESGIIFRISQLERLRAEVRPDYDLVTFAPRGVSPSGPTNLWTDAHIAAYLKISEELGLPASLGIRGMPARPGTLGAIGNLTTDLDAQFLLSQVDAIDKALLALHDVLTTSSGGSLKYVGITAVVRDVARIVNALDGENAPINWLGVSYGTIIGMQLIQLFPDRVGKFILDGVVDPTYWSDRPQYLGRSGWLADADAAYNGFTRVCVAAGPDNCEILQPGETAEALNERIRAGLDEIHNNYNASSPTSYLNIVTLMLTYMYIPNDWPDLVKLIGAFIGPTFATQVERSLDKHHKQLVDRLDHMPTLNMPVFPMVHHVARRQSPNPQNFQDLLAVTRSTMAMIAIACGDGADANRYNIETKQVFEEMIRLSREVSSMFGATYVPMLQCHKWTSRAVERYTGPWNAKPKNPVLVVSTELDPVTPFRSAQLITTDAFLGTSARLIRLWNFGHSSYASDSTCHQSAVFKYPNEDVLPRDKGTDGEDVVCPTESKILGMEPKHWVKDEDITPLHDDQSEQPGANNPGDTASTLSIARLAAGAAFLLLPTMSVIRDIS